MTVRTGMGKQDEYRTEITTSTGDRQWFHSWDSGSRPAVLYEAHLTHCYSDHIRMKNAKLHKNASYPMCSAGGRGSTVVTTDYPDTVSHLARLKRQRPWA